jgi:hypothetical protein
MAKPLYIDGVQHQRFVHEAVLHLGDRPLAFGDPIQQWVCLQ